MSDNPTARGPPVHALVTVIVSNYVKKNPVFPADMPELITIVYRTLMSIGKAPEPEPTQKPAVPIRQSVHANYVVCLECGRRAKMLRRHLQGAHGLSPEQYRARWKLSPEHLLAAPAYSRQRSVLAKQFGLGRGPARRRTSRHRKD